jgi:Cu2+-exporting ATPase
MSIRFSGDAYVLTALSSIIYFYGGWPFLDGLRQELRARLSVQSKTPYTECRRE